MSNFFKTKYRIVTDNYDCYEAQFKVWYWPFWIQCNGINTSYTLSNAKTVIDLHYQERNKAKSKFVEKYNPS